LAVIPDRSELHILIPTQLFTLVQFHNDAIVLSGITGTKLKCEILAGYYHTWWGITSGGRSRNNSLATALVEMNAGSSEDYIEETGETILGSSGHALKLKLETPNTSNLKLVLVEENEECFGHLKNVIEKRWPFVDLAQAVGPPDLNRTGIYLIHKKLNEAVDTIEKIPLRNVIFFFDPLLFAPWAEIERVAKRRILGYYQTGTEFIVFLFTSDWFKGRKKMELVPIPQTGDETQWSQDERRTVGQIDELLGTNDWRQSLLIRENDDIRAEMLVQLYRKRLHKWFRYIRPMPFKPKEGQTYHLFMCTNYERGIGITSSFYNKYTNNQSQKRALNDAYSRFSKLHPETLKEIDGKQRPTGWRFLVEITRDHDEGLCDERCADLGQIEPDPIGRKQCLQWLTESGYLDRILQLTDAWNNPPQLYRLNWQKVSTQLGLTPSPPLRPMQPRPS
jgi:three-Cys-motif partner protein